MPRRWLEVAKRMMLVLQPSKNTTDPKPLGYLLFQPLGFGPDEDSPTRLEESRREVLGDVLWQQGQGVGVDLVR